MKFIRNKRRFFHGSMAIIFAGLSLQAATAQKAETTNVQRPDISVTNTNYIGNREPLVPLSFIKLPVGSIKPEGWIKKYLELQRDGLTGHLGEISAWLDKENNAWYNPDGKGANGWEEVPYWLKGYGNIGYILNDPKMIAETQDWINRILSSQIENGYFGPKQAIDASKKSFDLWPNMIVLWVMQSYYEHSNDVRIIPFMTSYFKWQSSIPDDKLLEIYWENSRGGDNMHSIYWLYNRTGDKWLLDLATKIHKNTADWMQKSALPNMHNVNIAQGFREPATYYMQTNDKSHLQAAYDNFNFIRKEYGQMPGGMFASDENSRKGYDDPRQAVETCGMVEQMASDEIMLGITGDPMWADNCEDVAFNTYPAAVMPDFRSLRYLTAPNMVVSDSRNHNPGIDNSGPFLMMNPFSSRCCQHNHSQGWPYYAEHLWMASPDNGIAAVMYNSSEVTLKAGKGGKNVTLKQITEYPFSDKVIINVLQSENVNFPMYLRIPEWCENASIKINDIDQKLATASSSYIKISRNWKSGDKVELSLPMTLEKDVWTNNKNSVSLNYGPLTFSLKIDESYKEMDSKKSAIGDSRWQESVDQSKWKSYEIYPASMWNYGLVLNDKPLKDQFEIVRKPFPKDNFPFTQTAVPIELKAKGKIIPEWILDKNGLADILPQSPVKVSTPTQPIELIPMGAARLRISAFPVIAN